MCTKTGCGEEMWHAREEQDPHVCITLIPTWQLTFVCILLAQLSRVEGGTASSVIFLTKL